MYINMVVMALADLIAAVSSGVLTKLVGFGKGFTISFMIVIVASGVYTILKNIIAVEYICVFMMRFGLKQSFCICYFASSELFDSSIKSRSFAFCNFFARILTISSPMIVTLVPAPILVVTVMTVIASITSQMLQKPTDKED
jgi:hypothetical protein